MSSELLLQCDKLVVRVWRIGRKVMAGDDGGGGNEIKIVNGWGYMSARVTIF